MNLDLEERLEREGIDHERLPKARKVKLLSLWSKAFPELVASARRGESRAGVRCDKDADDAYTALPPCDFYILPDDPSDMPSYACTEAVPPDLSELVSDTFTRCDELVVVGSELDWSAVFVNHGASLVGRHFARRSSGDGSD